MAATRTQGITVDTNGNFTIDKEHRGMRIFLRLGPLSQEDAEHRLDFGPRNGKDHHGGFGRLVHRHCPGAFSEL